MKREGLLVQFPREMEEAVGGEDIVEGLCFALGVDGAAHVGLVAQNVEGVEVELEVAFHHSLGEAGVPHEFVGVHGMVDISSA